MKKKISRSSSSSKKTVKKKTAKKKSIGFSLPTEPSIEAVDIKDYILMFYGPPGVGKTQLAHNIGEGNSFFISMDRGTRYLKTMAKACHRWEDFDKICRFLEKPDAPKYSFIVIDHVDEWTDLCQFYICEKMGIESLSEAGHGRGWDLYKRELKQAIQRLLRLDTGLIFLAHETIKTIKTRTGEYERTMPSMQSSAWKIVVPLADLVGYVGFKTVSKGGKATEIRVIDTNPREDLYAKDRTQREKPEKWERLQKTNAKAFLQTFESEGE